MANTALRDQKERNVEVSRLKLLEILKSNREKHVTDYQEAVEGYKAMALQKLQEGYEASKIKLERNLERGKLTISDFDPSDPSKTSDYIVLVDAVSVSLKVPRNFSKEYDAAIDMANWDIRDVLELTHAEFQCFVRDVWEWSNDFTAISTMYKSSK